MTSLTKAVKGLIKLRGALPPRKHCVMFQRPLALDKSIHPETRLAILGLLRRRGAPVDFTTLREELGNRVSIH